ncbi:MAG: preprotein translocase subunit SecA [candidate division Zixibacteria bacterium]|nr:preprotein translocase subunit SecA [candidate division Zixibacteria bacterium]
MKSLITRLFGTKHDRDIKSLNPIVAKINEFFEQYEALSDSELKEKTTEFISRLKQGEELDDLIPETFAVVKQTCKRLCGQSWDVAGIETEWNMVPYDVQLIGAVVLHQGKISEMATGEGKTLVATMPIYLNALSGKGVHIVTVNDYLAFRDSQWMGKIFEFLGLTIGCIRHDMTPEERKEQYNAHVTYGTNNEFGFDYLRDNMVQTNEHRVHRGYHYAIVDEVDSLLIDEARTPLIISGTVEAVDNTGKYKEMQPYVDQLVRKQNKLILDSIKKAQQYLKEDDEFQAGLHLLSARRGAPKNKQLLKLEKETGIKKLESQAEAAMIRDKKMFELDEELYYVIDERENSINLTDNGRKQFPKDIQDLFLIPDLSEELSELEGNEDLLKEEKATKSDEIYKIHADRSEKVHNISQLLKGYSLYEKNNEYVVQDGKVVIVDEFTGRLMVGRRYSDGLHEAIEAKEGVKVEAQTQTLATITLQNYFRMYEKLAGMTGTAETEASEFFDIYKLDVVVIPTNSVIIRDDKEDQIFRTRQEKYHAIVEEIVKQHNDGRPTLVGTVSVEVSEILSKMLQRVGLKHNVLNAKRHQQEAEIVAEAGNSGAVTIATNMAGRGTDIKLGPGVVEAGGLHILGTERHESRRIDRQLRGRAGRQGDPGSSQFFLSLEDDLMRLFGSDRIATIMDKMGVQEGDVITHPMITKAIERAQKRVEAQNFSIRKHTLKYDDVMNQQREVIYGRRMEALASDDIKARIVELKENTLEIIVDENCPEKEYPEMWNWDELKRQLLHTFLLDIKFKEEDIIELTREKLFDKLNEATTAIYNTKEEAYGSDLMRKLEKYASLVTIDQYWRDHLNEVDELRTGIGLRAYGQRDPLLEYKKEAFKMFQFLMEQVDKDTVGRVYRMQVNVSEQPKGPRTSDNMTASHADTTGMGIATAKQSQDGQSDKSPMADASQRGTAKPIKRDEPKVGRNDPCPCGSGKKYKKCHGRGA